MREDIAVAQARELLRALHQQVTRISQNLEKVERRVACTSMRVRDVDRRLKVTLRSDLYEAHRHIEALVRRFPDIRHPAVENKTTAAMSDHHSERPATSRS